MVIPAAPDAQGTSTRPYLIRALHDWCTDNGFTPYLAVYVDASVQVPMEYVKNHEIVLNVGFDATSGLKLGNDYVEFKARFGGVARDIVVPVDHVIAIYARENGQGMAFPVPTEATPTVGPVDGDRGEAAIAVAAPVAPGLRLASAPSSAPTPTAAPTLAPALAPAPAAVESEGDRLSTDGTEPLPQPPAGGGRPSLKRIK